MTWQLKLATENAHLFARKNHVASGSPIAVRDGWNDIVERLLQDVAATGVTGVISEITSKYGTMRGLTDGSCAVDDETRECIEDAIDLAEARSAYQCEKCGGEGCLFELVGGWLITACHDHGRGRALPASPEDLIVRRRWVDGRLQITRCRRYARDQDRFVNVDPQTAEFDD